MDKPETDHLRHCNLIATSAAATILLLEGDRHSCDMDLCAFLTLILAFTGSISSILDLELAFVLANLSLGALPLPSWFVTHVACQLIPQPAALPIVSNSISSIAN